LQACHLDAHTVQLVGTGRQLVAFFGKQSGEQGSDHLAPCAEHKGGQGVDSYVVGNIGNLRKFQLSASNAACPRRLECDGSVLSDLQRVYTTTAHSSKYLIARVQEDHNCHRQIKGRASKQILTVGFFTFFFV